MISFELDEEQQLIHDTARKLAAERLWERIRETEQARELPPEIVAEAHDLGLPTLDLPEAVGGGGLHRITRCIVEEQLAWGDASACWALGGPAALGPFVMELGTEEQQKQILSPFSGDSGSKRRGAVAFSEARPHDTEGFATTAERDGDGWVLRGHKAFVVGGGVADRYVVVAQVDPDAGWHGLGAFLVPGDTNGLSADGRRRLLGIDAAHVADVRLDGVRVSNDACLGEGDITEPLVRAFAYHALVNGARAVGVAQRAFELTHAYTEERKAFGKPIGHFQAVAFNVADRLMDVEGARWMVWRAATEWDRKGEPDLGLVAGAAAHALEAAVRCGDDGVQLFGGAGFVRDYPIEKLYRDARQLSLMGPSIGALDQLAADRELGLPLDPAVALPTPDIQPACF